MIERQPFPWAKYGPTLQWCRVCGTTVWFPSQKPPAPENTRCERHLRRNPCAIDGCKRSTKAPWLKSASGAAIVDLALGQWFCSEHWRAFVPPGSPQRRIYQRFFRRAKRYGWTDESLAAFHRIWDRLVSRARARARGDLDVDEIYRVMGWEKESEHG